MTRELKLFAGAAAVVLTLLLGMPKQARADFVLQISAENEQGKSTTYTVNGSGGLVQFSGSVGDFSVYMTFATTNSPGNPTQALTQVGTFSITNNGTAAETIAINVSAQGFTSPQSPPPLEVLDTVSGSLVSGDVDGQFQGFADATNALWGTGFSAPNLIFSASGDSKSFSGNGIATGFSPNGDTYSETIMSSYTLSGGGSLTLSGGNVQTMVPAPSTAVFALTGLPLLGLVYCVRRRKTRKAPVAA